MKKIELHYQPHEVEPYINWLYFFNAWSFPPRFANVAQLHDCPSCRAQWLASFDESERAKAQEVQRLYDDARQLLRQLDESVRTHALVGLYEANGSDEDIIIHTDDGDVLMPMLRQQSGDTCQCWADYLMPPSTGKRDHVGVFVTSVDKAMVENPPLPGATGTHSDEYRQMLSQTLADRLAEATAERMHEEVRTRYWGYAKDEHLSIEEMFQERYVGRRPAVGYPSLPDQSLNFLIDKLLDMSRIGVSLTESGAMMPHASTSGLLFAHPKATHFAIGRIGEDQLHDYAKRRNLPPDIMRRFLAANL